MICPNCYAINADTAKVCITCRKVFGFDLTECLKAENPGQEFLKQVGIDEESLKGFGNGE